MALVNRAALEQRLFYEGGRQLFDAYSELLQPRPHWGEICTTFATNSTTIDLINLLDVPEYEREIGGVAFADLEGENLEITPKRFSAGLKMHEDIIDDDNMNVLLDRVADLGRAPENTFLKYTFLALKAGIAATYSNCLDGGLFFNNTHTNDAGSYSNYAAGGGSTAWYLLDCSHKVKPIVLVARKDPQFKQENPDSSHRFETGEVRWKVAGRMWMSYGMWQHAFCDTNPLTDTRIWTDIEAIRGYKDNAGRYTHAQPTHLCVAPDTEQTARELLERLRIQGTAAAPSNEPVQNLNLKLIVDPYLT